MITVKEMIRQLSKFPEDAWCYVYEGETTAVIVAKSRESPYSTKLGEVYASESKADEKEGE